MDFPEFYVIIVIMRTNVSILFSRTSLLTYFCWVCISTNVSSAPVILDPDSKITVSSGWTFEVPGQKPVPIQVAKSLSSQGFPPPIEGTYRLEFFFPNIQVTQAQGVYLNRVQEADKVYLNGQLVGETGDFEPYGRYSPNWFFKRLYFLPDSLLKRGETNVLEIKIFYKNQTYQGGLFRSAPELGSLNALGGNILFEDGRDAGIMMLFFGIGIYQIFSILFRKETKANFYLFCASLCFVFWRLPLLNITHSYSGLAFIPLLKIFFIFQTIFPLTIFFFSYALFKDPIRLKETILILLVLTFAFIHLFDIEISTRILLLRLWEASLPVLVFFVLRGVYRAFSTYRREAMILGTGFLILCTAGIIDIIIDISTGKNVYLSQYGFLLLMMLSATTISFRNAKIESDLAILTKELEERVHRRTEELKKKNYGLQQDLFFASQLQGHLLPKGSPSIKGLTLRSTYLPMEQVGGDFYDWVEVNEHQLIFLIADVAGHGVPAALVSSMVKVQFREITKDTADPAVILTRMNQSLVRLVSKYFITASCSLFDMREKVITISSAGHPNPLIYNESNPHFHFLNLKGSILGWKDSFSYVNMSEKLKAGDRYFFYTDGVTEARSDGKFFGEARLMRLIKENQGQKIDELAETIQLAILEYSDSELKDDLTYVIIEIN
jgi:sigma-B regulation protein RsbU (phosphoserine phosphatase)